MRFKKLGIALAGGGGKGAYQIGVWKALREHQLDTHIAAISGTSVGGLNGAMMAQGKYDQAEAMWLGIESCEMLSIQDLDWLASRLAALGAAGAISPLLLHFIETKGLFKRDGLQGMIDAGLDPELLATGAIPLTVALHQADANRVVYQPIREARLAGDTLLATAALPMIFDPVTLDGIAYSDGGFYWGLPHKNLDNIPIQPLVEAGCDTVIVVCLARDDLDLSPSRFPGLRLLPIVPSRSPGGLTATLDFSNEGAARRMDQGYQDAVHLLEHLDLFLSREDQYQALWQRVAASAEAERKAASQLDDLARDHARTVADIGAFDRIVAGDDFSESVIREDDDSLPAALETLALDNAALLADLDRQAIQTDVTGFLARHRNDRRLVEATVLDALAALSPVAGRGAHLREQDPLARVWGAVTGRNQTLAAENDQALAQAQFAALRLIAAVQDEGTLTLEFTCVLQNRLNSAFTEIDRQGRRQHQDLRRVYRSLAGVYTRLRDRLIQHEDRLAALERQGRLHHWLLHPNQTRQMGQPLAALPVALRLACLANDFFHLTQGDWTPEELVSLKEMCIQVGLSDTAPVSLAAFCAALLDGRETAQALLQRLAEGETAPQAVIPAVDWLRRVRDHRLPDGADLQDALSHWHHSPDSRLPAWDLLAELLYYLKAAGLVPLRHSELGQLKAAWIQQLAVLTQLAQDGILPRAVGDDIRRIEQVIDGFKLAVPLIGQFSVGKSTLLNTWLGRSVQKEDLNPCTATATEFHFAEAGGEKLVVHWRSATEGRPPEREERPLSQYPELLAGRLSTGRTPLFIELHCHLAALARHPDLVLVDTPGLGSNQDRHSQALEQYLGAGVVCILCVTSRTQVGKEELDFVQRQRALGQDFSVLVCQEDLGNASEREAVRRNVKAQAELDPDQIVHGCSARDGDFAGFEDILARLEQRKAQLFQKRLAPRIEQLLRQAERLLREQLAADTNADQLHAKKALIAKGMAALQDHFTDEERLLRRDCGGPIARQVLAMVSGFLRGRRGAYVESILNKRSIEPLLAADARNAFQLAAEQSLAPRFEEAAQTLGARAQLEAISQIVIDPVGVTGLDDDSGLGQAAAGALASVALGSMAARTPSAGASSAAFAALGSVIPGLGIVIGVATGGLIALLASRRNRQNEAEGLAHQAIEAVIAHLQLQIGPALQQEAGRFLNAVRQQIEQRLATEQQNLDRIAQHLQLDAQRRQALERRTQAALESVRQLLTPDADRIVH